MANKDILNLPAVASLTGSEWVPLVVPGTPPALNVTKRAQISQLPGGGSSGLAVGATAISSGTTLRFLYDNAGVLGETNGLTWDATNKSLTLGGATVTTSHPLLDMTQTWNAGAVTFTGLKLNVTSTASAAASLLMDLQLASGSLFSVSKAGAVAQSGGLTFNTDNTVDIGASGANRPRTGYFGTSAIAPLFGSGTATTADLSGGYWAFTSSNSYVAQIASAGAIGGSSSGVHAVSFGFNASPGGIPDVTLYRDAANTLALRNSTTNQDFRVYQTFTDASNYERAGIKGGGSTFYFYTESAGTGTLRDITIYTSGNLFFSPGAANRWKMDASGHFLANTDNTYDIGASGATRPRNAYIATGINVGASGTVPVVFQATAVNMNSVADTAFAITLPPNYTRYRVLAIVISHASVDLTAATTVQFGLFTSTGGGGTAVLSATSCTVSATADATANNLQFQAPTLASTSFTAATLQFRVTTAHGSAATADVALYIQPVP